MASRRITDVPQDGERKAVFAECIANYDVGDPENAEWPNNMISARAVVYASGRMARRGEAVRHNIDPDELALCRRLADEAAAIMEGVPVGMGSEAGEGFRPFFVVANDDETPAMKVTEPLVRKVFGGMLFPPVTITVEPLAEVGEWWSEVMTDFGEDEDEPGEEGLAAWRRMIAWFKGNREFVDTAFVRIGDSTALLDLKEDQMPPGTELTPSALPRLAIGLTRRGSVAGLFGYSVQT